MDKSPSLQVSYQNTLWGERHERGPAITCLQLWDSHQQKYSSRVNVWKKKEWWLKARSCEIGHAPNREAKPCPCNSFFHTAAEGGHNISVYQNMHFFRRKFILSFAVRYNKRYNNQFWKHNHEVHCRKNENRQSANLMTIALSVCSRLTILPLTQRQQRRPGLKRKLLQLAGHGLALRAGS